MLMRKMMTLTICTLFILMNATLVFSKEKNISAPPVGIQEEFVPTPEQIHQDVPIEQKCSSCHTEANQDIESKAINHFMTQRDCNVCHLNKSWIPLKIYRHLSGRYRPNSTPQECDSCHTTNSEFRAN